MMCSSKTACQGRFLFVLAPRAFVTDSNVLTLLLLDSIQFFTCKLPCEFRSIRGEGLENGFPTQSLLR